MTGRGLAGRRLARRILFTALALDAFVAFLLLSAPSNIGPMFDAPPSPPLWIVTAAFGILMNIVGLAWMVRILRADPEGPPRSWRATRER